jgi:hypothetical protein
MSYNVQAGGKERIERAIAVTISYQILFSIPESVVVYGTIPGAKGV